MYSSIIVCSIIAADFREIKLIGLVLFTIYNVSHNHELAPDHYFYRSLSYLEFYLNGLSFLLDGLDIANFYLEDVVQGFS